MEREDDAQLIHAVLSGDDTACSILTQVAIFEVSETVFNLPSVFVG